MLPFLEVAKRDNQNHEPRHSIDTVFDESISDQSIIVCEHAAIVLPKSNSFEAAGMCMDNVMSTNLLANVLTYVNSKYKTINCKIIQDLGI